MHLAREHGHRLHLVDFPGGAVWRLWKKEGVEFTFQAYERGINLEIDRCDTVLISLLGAKLIGTRFFLADEVRLILWCTAPQDPFKFLPGLSLQISGHGKHVAPRRQSFREAISVGSAISCGSPPAEGVSFSWMSITSK